MFFRRTTASHMEAITIFKDNVTAFIAQRILDGFVLTEPHVTLDIKFVQEKEEEEEVTTFLYSGEYFRTIRRQISPSTANMRLLLLIHSSKLSEGSVEQG
jgi:hypothetical protein